MRLNFKAGRSRREEAHALFNQATSVREVLDCGSPLPLFIRTADDAKAPEGWRSPRRWRDSRDRQSIRPPMFSLGRFNLSLLTSAATRFFFAALLLLLGAGCATMQQDTAERLKNLPPADGFQTHRAVFTALGKQYTFNGYLATSSTGGKRLLITENFGMVFADVLVKPDGKIYVMQANKIFTPRRIRKFIAADLAALFDPRLGKSTPVNCIGPGHLFLKRSFYSLDLRIVQTKPGAQAAEMFDETKALK